LSARAGLASDRKIIARPKAVLKPPQSRRWRVGARPANLAKRMGECGAFTRTKDLDAQSQLAHPSLDGLKIIVLRPNTDSPQISPFSFAA
jgi:hypothetical protein